VRGHRRSFAFDDQVAMEVAGMFTEAAASVAVGELT